MHQEPIDYKIKLHEEYGVMVNDMSPDVAQSMYGEILEKIVKLRLALLECLAIDEAKIVKMDENNKALFETWLAGTPLVQNQTFSTVQGAYEKYAQIMYRHTIQQDHVLYRIAESGFITTVHKLITLTSLKTALIEAIVKDDKATFTYLSETASEHYPGNVEVPMIMGKLASSLDKTDAPKELKGFFKAAFEEKATETLIQRILMNPYRNHDTPQEYFWDILSPFRRSVFPATCLKQEALYQFVQKEVGKLVSSPDLKIQKLKHFREAFRVVLVGSIFNDELRVCSIGSYQNESCRKIDEWIKILELGQTAPLPLNEHVGTHSTVFFGYSKDYKIGTPGKPAMYDDEQAQKNIFEGHRI